MDLIPVDWLPWVAEQAGVVRVMLPARAQLKIGDKFPCRFPDMEKLAVVTRATSVSEEMVEVEMKLEDKPKGSGSEEENDD